MCFPNLNNPAAVTIEYDPAEIAELRAAFDAATAADLAAAGTTPETVRALAAASTPAPDHV